MATCELEAEGERRRGRGRQIPRRRARRPGRAHRHAVMASSPKQETAHRKQETARRKELWREFAQQPGTHLRWELAGGLRRAELRTAEQQTIASVRGTIGPGLDGLVTVSTGGRSFTGKKVLDLGNPGSWPPGIAEFVGHPEGQKLTQAIRRRVESLRWLADETGTPVLYSTGKHLYHRTEVAQYRAPSRHPFTRAVEITAHPDWKLTDELVLAIAISAPWLHWVARHLLSSRSAPSRSPAVLTTMSDHNAIGSSPTSADWGRSRPRVSSVPS